MGLLNVSVIKFLYRNEKKKKRKLPHPVLSYYRQGKKLFDKIDYFRLSVHRSIHMWRPLTFFYCCERHLEMKNKMKS